MFTKRTIQANEELTFDYQFQTFGKKRHKCYCGSDKCRGYLGSSGNNNNNNNNANNANGGVNPTLDYIWEDDSSSSSSSSDESGESSSSSENNDDDDEENNDDDDKSDKSNIDEIDFNKRLKDNNKDFDVSLLDIY